MFKTITVMSLICTYEIVDIFLDMAYLSMETLCVSMFRGDEDFFFHSLRAKNAFNAS